MTKQALWEAFIERYPQFKDGDSVVKLKSRGLRRMIDQAWDEGHAKGVRNGRPLEKTDNDKRKPENLFGGFGGIFDKK